VGAVFAALTELLLIRRLYERHIEQVLVTVGLSLATVALFEGIWSPEHLYTAAAEVCLMTTFLSIAEKAKLAFKSYKSEAVGTLEKVEKGMLMTKIHIKPTVVIDDESQMEKTVQLLEKAEKYCLISNSMKTEVTIEPIVLVK
jgi:organic hydroperoxide reductase OsmC/OhrA